MVVYPGEDAMAVWSIIGKFLSANVFPIICYLLAAYFMWGFCIAVEIPPTKPLNATSGGYLALALFLFILPEAKKLKLGQLFEYEAKVKEIKQEVKEFKEETRAALTSYATLVSTISNTVGQNVTVNIPGAVEAAKAEKELEETLKDKSSPEVQQDIVAQFLQEEENDLNLALAKLRMQLERELRRIQNKRTDIISPQRKFLSLRSLFKEFVQDHEDYAGLGKSLDYVISVCNAAIHGQMIPADSGHEALSLGLRMLSVLRTL